MAGEVPAREQTGRRRVLGWVVTGLAALVVFLALIAPPEARQVTLLVMLRIPVEGLIAAALLLVLPPRQRRIAALTFGALLGLLTVLRILQWGFVAVLGRSFDPVFDWPKLDDAAVMLERSMGGLGAFAAQVGAVVLAIALFVAMTLSVARLATMAIEHRRATGCSVAALAVVWLACLALSVQLAPPLPVASRSVAALSLEAGQQVWTSLENQRRFDAEVDASDEPSSASLLAALRGKDVIFAFVESYGRIALEDPEFAPTVDAILSDGTRRLDAAGFASRSAFLNSPVSGGESWLAHATLQSGLRVTNQYSFDKLIGSDRSTLTSAFRSAGWRTVAVMPATNGPWPAGAFYGFDKTYDEQTLGIRSRTYHGFQTPDQYTLSAFQRREREPANRPPLMAEIALVSSHWPWHQVPNLRDWNDIGDGAVFEQPDAGQNDSAQVVMLDTARMRDGYRRTLAYSLSTLISYVQTYGDDNLVLVFLGDHQPPAYLFSENIGLDAPITIVTRDRDVVDRIAGWGWQAGLRPSPNAPVWPMESFRDRFLTTFSR